MADIFSELKNIDSLDVSRDGIVEVYTEVEHKNGVYGDYYSSNQVNDLIKKYGWRSVSQAPPDSGAYFVTIADKTGNYVAMANYDPLHYNGDHWQIDGVVAWMPMPEMYKPEAKP
jgi:hypothetical protein